MNVDIEKVREYRLWLLEKAGLCVEGDPMDVPEGKWLETVKQANFIISARREREKRELEASAPENS